MKKIDPMPPSNPTPASRANPTGSGMEKLNGSSIKLPATVTIGDAQPGNQVPDEVVDWAMRLTLERLAGRSERFYLYRLAADLAEELGDMPMSIRTLMAGVPVAGERRTALMREILGKVRSLDRASRNVFGGGLPLYAEGGDLIGALGLSGDSSVADHIICWKLRDALGLDHIPGGVSPTKDDNMVVDFANGTSPSGWGHAATTPAATAIVDQLPTTHPTGR